MTGGKRAANADATRLLAAAVMWLFAAGAARDYASAQTGLDGKSLGWQTDVKTGRPTEPVPPAASPEPKQKASRPRRATAPEPATAETAAPTGQVRARAAALNTEGERTVFTLDLTGSIAVQVYTLATPHRVVVIDLADVAFELPANAGREGRGLVSAYRYGLIEAGKARIVLDLARPARIEAADLQAHGAAGHSRLVLQLVPVDDATFIAGAAAAQPAPAPEAASAVQEEAPVAKADARRTEPVIVIDPGHGGVDPGAVGSTDVTEKAVVLAVAKQLAAILGSGKRYRVVLTRNNDVFVALDKRIEISRRHEADLFISIHADAVTAQFAQAVRGATIYTLAERASDERARLLAEKENAADALAGIAPVADGERDQVAGILLDLMKRETANFSHEISGLLTGRLKGALSLAKDPQRGAAFKVLKQMQSPSVLIELGYMTNQEDERQLSSPEWQRKVAQAIAAAIDAYFAKRVSAKQ